VQKLREKQINFDKMVQPYQEQIAQLVDTVEKKVAEFKSSKDVIDTTDDPLVTDIMLTTAQETVTDMDKDLAELKATFQKTSQEAKEKLQKKKPDAGGSGTSHK
jgi:cell division protein ZapA (FtsZ GTPase activity inhibitor)